MRPLKWNLNLREFPLFKNATFQWMNAIHSAYLNYLCVLLLLQVRPYTPTKLDPESGYLELVVKAYDQAKMSKHLHSLKAGSDAVEMFGPVGSLK
jgi:hypothetical protein